MQLVMKRLWPERSEVELIPPPEEEPDLDLSKLSQEELDLLEELAERVLRGTRSGWGGSCWGSCRSRPVPAGSYAARGSTTSMLRRVHAGFPAPPQHSRVSPRTTKPRSGSGCTGRRFWPKRAPSALRASSGLLRSIEPMSLTVSRIANRIASISSGAGRRDRYRRWGRGSLSTNPPDIRLQRWRWDVEPICIASRSS